MGCGAIRPQDTVQLLDPTSLCFTEPAFESSEDDSVCSLGLPVGLRVLDRGEVLFCSQFGDEVLEPVVGELGVVVGHQWSRDSKSREDVSLVEMEDGVRGDLRESLGFYPFREVIHDHDEEFILVRSEERRVGKECRSRWSPYH